MPPPTKAQRKRCAAVLEAFHKRFSAVYGDERWHRSLYPALVAPTRQAALVNLTSPNLDAAAVSSSLRGEQIPFLSIPCLQPTQSEPPPPPPPQQQQQHSFPPPPDNSYYLLDAASVVAVQALDVQPAQRVLDLCAAPGGKSIAIAVAAAAAAAVDANEFDRARFRHLQANLRHHLPAERFRVTNLDGTQAQLFERGGEGGYDRVLVDAPCSSERHIIHAHAKKAAAGQLADELVNWRPVSSASSMVKTQLALLRTALAVVKLGGRVVYATCSLEPEENDGVVDRLLTQPAAEKWSVQVVHVDDELDAVTEKTRHGRIMLPDHPSGHEFGPIYFAVLKKVQCQQEQGPNR